MHLLQLGLFMYSHQFRTLPLKLTVNSPYKKKFIRIIQETLIYIVCLSAELTSNSFPFFTKDLNFTTQALNLQALKAKLLFSNCKGLDKR